MASRRQCYRIPGVDHAPAPIPLAARVGSSFQSSAIMGKDPDTGTIPPDGVRQVGLAFRNTRTLLDVAGVALDQLVFVEVFLADDGLRAEVNRHWCDWFPDPDDRPARHTTLRELAAGMVVQLRVQAVVEEGAVNDARPPTDDVVKAFSAFATSGISDALDRLGIAGQAYGIAALEPSFRLAGRAFTALYQPVDSAGGTVGDYIDDVPPGGVVVLDNGGRTDVTVWGDILTMVASRRSLAGTVIDGVCRDSIRSRELNFPVFSRGRWMRTGKDRVQMVATEVPVTIGRVRVRPADIVVGDGDGVVIIPREREAEVLSVVTEIEESESRIRELIADGTPLDAARRSLGYHTLQTRRPAGRP